MILARMNIIFRFIQGLVGRWMEDDTPEGVMILMTETEMELENIELRKKLVKNEHELALRGQRVEKSELRTKELEWKIRDIHNDLLKLLKSVEETIC